MLFKRKEGKQPKEGEQFENLILYLRSLVEGTVEIQVQNGVPQHLEVPYPSFINRRAISQEPLTEVEQSVLETMQFMRFGKLIISVKDGKVTGIVGGSQKVRLNQPFDIAEWQN